MRTIRTFFLFFFIEKRKRGDNDSSKRYFWLLTPSAPSPLPFSELKCIQSVLHELGHEEKLISFPWARLSLYDVNNLSTIDSSRLDPRDRTLFIPLNKTEFKKMNLFPIESRFIHIIIVTIVSVCASQSGSRMELAEWLVAVERDLYCWHSDPSYI